jgi:lysozyme family protein
VSNFDTCLQFVLQEEGGYVDDPRDPGGATNFGITQYTYDKWRTKKGLPVRSVALITQDEVAAIYKEEYWDANNLEPMPQVWQLFLFDSYVQHSPHVVQGFIAGASVSDALWARIAFYVGLTTFQYFGKGWIRRMCHLRTALKAINAQV